MIKLTRTLVVFLLCALAWLSAPTAFAGHSLEVLTREVNLAADIGPDQAAAIVRDRTGGRVLGVRAVKRQGRTVYQVKVLKDGHVRIYNVDASSGNILG